MEIRSATTTTQGAARTISVNPTGAGGQQPVDQPPLPQNQRSQAADAEVISRTLAFGTSDYSGCGVAGCTRGLLVNAEQGLVLSGLHGEHPRLVTKGGFDYSPAFSPDGRLVAYLSRRHPTWAPAAYNVAVDDIALMTSEGRTLGVFVQPAKEQTIQGLMWSADSNSLAYSVNDSKGRQRIIIRSLRTHRARAVAVRVPLRALAWSPDERTFVGVGSLPSQPGVTPTGDDLWLISSATGIERRLTHFGRAPLPSEFFCGMTGPARQEIDEPVWSPDGRQIAFVSSYAYATVLGNEFDVRVVTVRSGVVTTALHPTPMRCLHRGVREVMGAYQRVDVLGWT